MPIGSIWPVYSGKFHSPDAYLHHKQLSDVADGLRFLRACHLPVDRRPLISVREASFLSDEI